MDELNNITIADGLPAHLISQVIRLHDQAPNNARKSLYNFYLESAKHCDNDSLEIYDFMND